jgi:hypothetical protein
MVYNPCKGEDVDPDGDKPLPDDERARLFGEGWPAMLIRACEVHGDYIAGIELFGVIRFTRAYESGLGWVSLIPNPASIRDERTLLAFPFPAGVAVRVSRIQFVAQHPEG